MGDSVSSYYDDLAEREAAEQAEREKTVEYWRERALAAEAEMAGLREAARVLRRLLG